MVKTEKTRLTIPTELEGEFTAAFGVLAQKELESIISEALYRNYRLTNKNIERSKKVLPATIDFDTITDR